VNSKIQLAKDIMDVLRHNREGATAWDDASYMIESMCRGELGMLSARSHREVDGTLVANFADGQIRYEGGV